MYICIFYNAKLIQDDMTLDEMRAMVARGGAKVRGVGCGKDDCFLKSERNKFPGVGLDRTREKGNAGPTPDGKKSKKGGGRPRHKESTLQITCVKWFNAIYPEHQGLLFSVPNGGQRNAITAKIMKAEGVVAGVSDLILFMPRRGYHALCIEMKVDTNKQSENQKIWQKKAEGEGYLYKVIYTIEDFAKLVKWYLSTDEVEA